MLPKFDLPVPRLAAQKLALIVAEQSDNQSFMCSLIVTGIKNIMAQEGGAAKLEQALRANELDVIPAVLAKAEKPRGRQPLKKVDTLNEALDEEDEEDHPASRPSKVSFSHNALLAMCKRFGKLRQAYPECDADWCFNNLEMERQEFDAIIAQEPAQLAEPSAMRDWLDGLTSEVLQPKAWIDTSQEMLMVDVKLLLQLFDCNDRVRTRAGLTPTAFTWIQESQALNFAGQELYAIRESMKRVLLHDYQQMARSRTPAVSKHARNSDRDRSARS